MLARCRCLARRPIFGIVCERWSSADVLRYRVGSDVTVSFLR